MTSTFSGIIYMSEFDMKPVDIAKRLTTDERIMRVGFPEGLSPRQANAITQARIQYGLALLAERNVERIEQWLIEVGSKAPAEAIRLYMELLEFRLPRLKATQVNLNANADLGGTGQRKLHEMSMEELASVVAEQG
jgi:hypothetical protein